MRRLIALSLLCLMLTAPLYAQDDTPTPYEIALQRIEAAREIGATELDLSWLGLTEVPPDIGQLSNLQWLYLGYNQLTTLPRQIGQLSNLQNLIVQVNQLTELPPEIRELSNLQVLNVYNNRLTTLPSEIGMLSNLRWLNLWGNHLSTLPAEIGMLTNLQGLILTANRLTALPDEIGRLRHLCVLDLRGNNLRHLTANLSNLNLLAIQGRCSGIPSALYLDGNPLISPPPQVVEQGTAAVLAYLRNQAWYHTQQLIISAAGGVGLFALLLLGFRWKQHGGRKPKQKRG